MKKAERMIAGSKPEAGSHQSMAEALSELLKIYRKSPDQERREVLVRIGLKPKAKSRKPRSSPRRAGRKLTTR